MRRRRFLMGLLGLLILLLMIWMVHPIVFRAMARWLDVGERPHRADYIMLLNGGERTRPFAAAALVKAGWSRKVLLGQVVPDPTVEDGIIPPYHEMNRDVMIRRGVPAEDIIILPNLCEATFDEAKALAQFLKDHPNVKVLVVTQDYHTRRSRWAFARALGERAGEVTFISVPSEELDMGNWWQSERSFGMICSEYLKLAFYAGRYGYFVYWLAACCVWGLVVWGVRRRGFDFLA